MLTIKLTTAMSRITSTPAIIPPITVQNKNTTYDVKIKFNLTQQHNNYIIFLKCIIIFTDWIACRVNSFYRRHHSTNKVI